MATAGTNAPTRILRADVAASIAKYQAFTNRINRAASRAKPVQVKHRFKVTATQVGKRPIAWTLKLRDAAVAALRDRASRRRRHVEPDSLARTTEVLAQSQHTHAPTPGYQPGPVASEIEAARTLAAPRAPSDDGSFAVA